MRVAILDDDSSELRKLEKLLGNIHISGSEPWDLHSFERGGDLLRQLKSNAFDLMILDWSVTDVSGLMVLKWSRKYLEFPPSAIMLTCRGLEQDIVLALNEGADDYIIKPLREDEFRARVLAVARKYERLNDPPCNILNFDNIRFNIAEQEVLCNDVKVMLTDREYKLARCLFKHLGRPLSRQYLYDMFWPSEEIFSSRPLDTHIYRIRQKLGLTFQYGWHLRTIYGYGYCLEQTVIHHEV
ncbi:response regulator transcription factor [Pseudomonas sp. BF61]|uniref:response regulator transcription factor n=1 Tax=Pseudomonas sp. BF61 TaxID=2741068 RepID=UPI001C0ACA32|nr:response regulator transcription factor [Pseudomonas sp. BF61]MBU4629259.1 response regulator transcription factor [Pseudomonas sp. BF61]